MNYDAERLKGLRAHFVSIGDIGLVRECDAALERLGVVIADPVPEEAPRLERAVNPKVPAKRSRRSN